MKIDEVLKPPFRTPFDEMSFYIDPKQKGGYVRDRLLEFENELGRVVEMATVAAYRTDIAKARWQAALAAAISEIEKAHAGDRSYPAARKEAMAKQAEIILVGDEEKTTPYIEETKYISYKYISDRGRDKVRELNSAIDLGRSVLSWDKEELSRING